jgi:hypothetical protein
MPDSFDGGISSGLKGASAAALKSQMIELLAIII